MLTPVLHLQVVAGGVGNHPLLRLSLLPLALHINADAFIHTLHIFLTTLTIAPPLHECP